MMWDHWDPAGAPVRDVWSRTDNSEPLVSKYGLSYSRSSKWNSWEYQSVVEWNNPTDSVAIVDISGYFKLTWAGVGGAPDVGLDAVITKYNSITNTYTEFLLSRYSNPAPGSASPVDLTVPISFLNQRFGEGDSLLLSLRAVSAPSQLDSWNVLNDGGMKITLVSLVPEPETYAMLLGGLGLLALGARRRQSATV